MNESTASLELIEPEPPVVLVPDTGWSLWLAAGLGMALVITAIVVIRMVRKKSSYASPAALREAAFRDALAALNAIRAAETRDIAVQASLILRSYLAAAAADPALYETHEEFISRHDALQSLTADARNAAGTGFSRLATLKYAPQIPTESPDTVLGESRSLLETLHHGFAA